MPVTIKPDPSGVPDQIGPTDYIKDSLGRAAAQSAEPGATVGTLVEGTVMRATPGTNDLCVNISGGPPNLSCKYAPGMLVREFGIRSTSLPPEGTTVLVYRSGGEASTDLVLCCLPPVLSNVGGTKSKVKSGLKAFLHMLGEEPGASFFNLDAWRRVFGDKTNKSSFSANAGRAFDVIPGERYDVTDAGAFQALLNFMSGIGASQRAKLECFVFDDMVRLTTGQWQHYHSLGETQIFNDEGHASLEMGGSWFTPENFGEEDYRDLMVLQKQTETPGHAGLQYRANQLRAMKCRYQLYVGALGDFANLFICDPRDGKTEVPSAQSNHRGLLRMSINSDGSLDMRSASGMTFERTDAIPVPKRMRDPWDPEGDGISSSPDSIADDLVQPRTMLELPEDHPNARNLLRADINAYRDAQAYQRFDELRKDFHVPQAKDVPALRDEYDHLGSSSDLAAHAGKRCGCSFDPDGSFHLWGGGGCEIFARDGTLILAAPKGVMVQTGGSLVALSRDIVLKSSNSTDITASQGDIRMAAKGNMHLFTKDKGILLETESKNLDHGFAKGTTGEAVNSSGITILARQATVFVSGSRTIIDAVAGLYLSAKTSTLRLVSKWIGLYAETVTALGKEGKAGLTLGAGSALVFGDNAILAGESGAGVFRGDQAWVPKEYVTAQDVATPAQTSGAEQYLQMYDGETWAGGYREDLRDAIMFTYRSTDEYGTDGLKLYETVWQHELRTRAGGEFDKWTEEELNSTFPWPGKDAREQAVLRLSGYVNVDKTTGKTLDRDDVRDRATVGTFEVKPMDDYIVTRN